MPLTFEFCRDRICPNITIFTEFSSPPKQYCTCGDAGPCIETLDACPENRQPATREERDKAHGFELIHLEKEWVDKVIKATEAAEAQKPEPLKEVLIAETGYTAGNRADRTKTDFGPGEEGAMIIGTSAGIIARFSNEGGYCGDEVEATWADVLKHAPAELMIKELESTGYKVI